MKCRKKSWVSISLVVIAAVAVGILVANFAAPFMGMGKLMPDWRIVFHPPFYPKEIVHILMIGVDNSGHKDVTKGGLSDTLVVFSLNTKTREIRAISIPRDTYVEIPGHRNGKINSAHALGGPELARQVVSNLLGTPIDYYVKTDVEGLVKVVDLLGGVYIIVDKDMKYDDNWGHLHIDLKGSPEKQLLNGTDAMGYVRFRHDAYGDTGYRFDEHGNKVATGRVVRQQQFFKALANRILALPTRRARADILQTAYEKKYIDSDLNAIDWGGIADYFKDADPEKIHMDVLPGAPKMIGRASCYAADKEKIPSVVAMDMNFIGSPAEKNIFVEVLNGSGATGIAGSAKEKLESAGFQVTKTGNAPNFEYPKAIVIKRVKDNDGAVERIARLFNSQDIREETPTKGQPEVTVIVGKDYVR